MNTTEFETWWTEHKLCFPDTRNWVRGLGAEDGQAMLKGWQRALSDVELVDALEVTNRIVSGDEEPIKAYERELTASVVRRLARKAKDRRCEPVLRDEASERYRRPQDRGRLATGNMAKALERTEELAKQGVPPSQILDQVLAEMPEAFPENEYTDRRYKCNRCLDSGTVEVWTNKAVKLVREGEINGREGCLVAAVFCDCRLGERGDEKEIKTKIVRFNPKEHCACPHGHTTSLDNRIALAAWVSNYRPRNYDRSFDAYNGNN